MEKEIRKDIRMDVVKEDDVMQFLNALPGSWIYIKHLNNTYINDAKEQVVTYTKFKVKNVDTYFETILIYGTEDDDRLVVDKESIISYQMTPARDELFIQVDTCNNKTNVYIKKYLPSIKQRLNEIVECNQNLIITEGKTDWKHLKSALSYFKNIGLYKDIKFTFFEYEDEIEMGADTLLRVLEYNQLFYNSGIKIFIFDADKEDINKKHEGKEFVDWGNNVYSFIIPVPDFRKDTPLISIENYYTDKEIKTYDEAGRRLYINNEFNFETGLLNNDVNIFDAQYGKHKKLPSNHIIDNKIYLVSEEIEICNDNIPIIKSNCPNIALSKNCFANYILKKEKPFNEICFDNFKLIFDIVKKIQNRPIIGNISNQNDFVCEVKISTGVYIKTFSNGLKTLEIRLKENEKIQQLRKKEYFAVSVCLSMDVFKITIYEGLIEILNIPIPISIELVQFLYDKIDNQYNRIELHFISEMGTSIVEVLNGDSAEALINRELAKLYS